MAGKGVPLNMVAVNDPINFAISARNLDPTNSRTLQLFKADGTVLFQCDASGVKVSPDGTLASVPATLTATQTFTNKTFTSPILGGTGQTAAGVLGWDAANNDVQVGDGTVAEPVHIGVWKTFVPTLTQGVGLTLSTAVGRYTTVGKLVIAQVDLVISGAGTAGSSFVLGALPVNARAPVGGYVLGHGRYFDAVGGTRYTVELVYAGVNSVFLQAHNVTNLFGIAPAVTAANTHQLAVSLMYEAA